MRILALLGALALGQGADSPECRKAVEQVVFHCAPAASSQKPDQAFNRAEEQQQWFQSWYQKLGFNIIVPQPAVSNSEFARRQKLDQFLVYHPASQAVSYTAFMEAVGQGKHWTVTADVRRKIQWEETKQGHWFWAEASADCPRLGETWYQLTEKLTGLTKLLSLEEYLFFWYSYQANTNQMIDTRTWSLLRTRYKFSDGRLGALDACGYDGGVFVGNWLPESLGVPYDSIGGRAAEVVLNVP